MVWDPEIGWRCVKCYDEYLNNEENRKILDIEADIYEDPFYLETLEGIQENYKRIREKENP